MSTASSPKSKVRNRVFQLNVESEQGLESIIQQVQGLISPVWPLADSVAVNPYAGFAESKFLSAREQLQATSTCETLMPLAYYQARFKAGHFGLAEIDLAIDEMVADKIPHAESLNAQAIHEQIGKADVEPTQTQQTPRISSVSQQYDQIHQTSWTVAITDEICKYCSLHYDEGQAGWASPFRDLPLYQAWRSGAEIDRRVELLGLSGFRRFVSNLPVTPEAAVFTMLHELGVPQEIWPEFLFSLAMTIPGWSAWAKYNTVESAKTGFENPDFAALLAMRLAYEVALTRRFGFQPTFGSESNSVDASDGLVRLTLLRANEIAFRSRILQGMSRAKAVPTSKSSGNKATQRKLAQMVFCIDVRSERIRRNLERVSSEIETFGFAGFFGMPIEYVRLGDESGTSQLPVLVDPKFRVYEEIRGDADSELVSANRSQIRGLRALWKTFQTSAVSCFAFVETTGLFYAYKLASRLFGVAAKDTSLDGVSKCDHEQLGPGFRDLHRQGVSNTDQVDLAESMLRGMGLTKDFAKLVLLCGHSATTENNPLQAGLECGACAGHSGEPNARFGAMLLNKPYIRQKLAERGIEISPQVHFVGAVHNTTTDVIRLYDLDVVPESHLAYVDELQQHASLAGNLTREERLQVLPGQHTNTLVQRSMDWSEVRPEWGLTGNAAFVVGPRSLTQSFDLNGESFLHSYDYRNDAGGVVLEQIMTAPLVVTNMINMQYYASTVDPDHFGSGNKTIHNVVGKFGVLSGNGGDLRTGLPWQSIHNGQSYEHDPRRLLTIIEAPRETIGRILEQHQNVRALVVNGWINLVAVDAEQFYRYTENGEWQLVETGEVAKPAQATSPSS